MLIVDALIVKGVKFVLNRLAEAVDAELLDESHLREELLAAQMKLELGEIDDAEFASIEAGVLAGLREIAAKKRGTATAAPAVSARGGKLTVESVSAELGHREVPDDRR